MTNRNLLRIADLPQNSPTPFDLRPTAGALDQIAANLDLLGLRKLRLQGDIRARGRTDWELIATLGATVVQPCVATLAPVTTRIDTPLRRLFLSDWQEPDTAEVEMTGDEDAEPLTAEVDLDRIMTEALALALPQYPRAEGAEPGNHAVTEPGKTPMTDDDAKPFAGLAALRDGLKKGP